MSAKLNFSFKCFPEQYAKIDSMIYTFCITHNIQSTVSYKKSIFLRKITVFVKLSYDDKKGDITKCFNEFADYCMKKIRRSSGITRTKN